MEREEQVHVHVSHVYGMDSTFNVFTCIHAHYSIMPLYVQHVYDAQQCHCLPLKHQGFLSVSRHPGCSQ